MGLITTALSAIFDAIAYFLNSILTLVIDLILRFAQYNNFLRTNVVNEGWGIIRDIVNMFFVLMFLVIAFATVLKIEKYSYKRLLFPLLLMALLVNFSKTICGLVIDFAQVIMLSFVNAFRKIGPGNFLEMFSIRQAWELPRGVITWIVGDWGKVASSILAVFISFIALVVTSIICILLILRIVALWILIILSPFAFIFYILPGTQRYARLWQDKFVQQVIIGPVLAFCLWLAFYAFSRGDLVAPAGEDLQVGMTEAGSSNNFARFTFATAMLVAGLFAARQLGVVGASLAGKGIGFLQKTAEKTAGWIGRRVDRAQKFAQRLAVGVATQAIPLVPGLKVAWGRLTGKKPPEGKTWRDVFYEEWRKGREAIPGVKTFKKVWGMIKGRKPEEKTEEETEREMKGLEAILKELGGAAGLAANEIKDLINLLKRPGFMNYISAEDRKKLIKELEDKVLFRRRMQLAQEEEDAKRRRDKRKLEEIKEEKRKLEKIKEIFSNNILSKVPRPKDEERIIKKQQISDFLFKEGKGLGLTDNEAGVFKNEVLKSIEKFLEDGNITEDELNGLMANLSQELTVGLKRSNVEEEDITGLVNKGMENLREILTQNINVIPTIDILARAKDIGGWEGYIREVGRQAGLSGDALDKFVRETADFIRPQIKKGYFENEDEQKKFYEKLKEQLDKYIEDKDEIKSKIWITLEPELKLIPPPSFKERLADFGNLVAEKMKFFASRPLAVITATLETMAKQGITLDPDIWMKDIKNYNARRTRMREADKLGQIWDLANIWTTFGKDETTFKNLVEQQYRDELEREIILKTGGDTDQVFQELVRAIKAGDSARALAALSIQAEMNDLNENFKGDNLKMMLPLLKESLRDLIGKKLPQYDPKTGRQKIDAKGNPVYITFTPEMINQVIESARERGMVDPALVGYLIQAVALRATKGNEDLAARHMARIGMVALEKGSPHLAYGRTRLNPVTGKMEFLPLNIMLNEKGKYELVVSRETMDAIAGKILTFSTRDYIRRMFVSLLGRETEEHKIKGLDELSKHILVKIITGAMARQFHEAKGRLITQYMESPKWIPEVEALIKDLVTKQAEMRLKYEVDPLQKADALQILLQVIKDYYTKMR